MDYLEHHYDTSGTCNCEFDMCSEYIYDRIEHECPDPGTDDPEVMNGPTCGYVPYTDFSESIEWYAKPECQLPNCGSTRPTNRSKFNSRDRVATRVT